jgi:hypothetical protein
MEVNGQLHSSAALSPVKETAVATELEAGWLPELVWVFEKIKYLTFA